jgi:hypothetical protein
LLPEWVIVLWGGVLHFRNELLQSRDGTLLRGCGDGTVGRRLGDCRSGRSGMLSGGEHVLLSRAGLLRRDDVLCGGELLRERNVLRVSVQRVHG